MSKKNPYSKSTDEELVALAQGGDNIALETIILRYKNFVCAKAKTYYLAGADEDDMIQEGLIGIYNAVKKFDGERFPYFKLFAIICVKNRMKNAVTEATRKKHRPLNSYISLDSSDGIEGLDFPLSETIADEKINSNPEAIFINRENYTNVSDKINNYLSSFEFDVLVLYLEDRSYGEIAQILKRDEKSVDNAIQRIKKKLFHLKANKDI